MDKQKIREHFDRIAEQRPVWFRRNKAYHAKMIATCQHYVQPNSRVLELGCSTGNLLGEIAPQHGVGVDFSARSIEIAKAQFPNLEWCVADVENLPMDGVFAEPFDVIIIEDLLGYLEDIQQFLIDLKRLIHPQTRIIVSTWNWLWQPIFYGTEFFHLKTPTMNIRENWLSAAAIEMFLKLADYSVAQHQGGLWMPLQTPLVAQSITPQQMDTATVSVIVPTRNEKGNIEALVNRIPAMGKHTEIIFVDGNSTDGTVEEIHHHIRLHPEKDIKFIPQIPPQHNDSETPPNLMLKLGKGDAVRKGFDAAMGDILMILDSDISVLPEDLTKFYDAITKDKGRFINGTRFVYSQEKKAMRFLNRLGNVFFSRLFSWLLGQYITDTLCGTKVLYRSDYAIIKQNRSYFGDFDPFGDFDLLFGAAWINLPLIEVPVQYKARSYGESKVRVGLHGPLLGKMSLIAFWHFKIRPLFGSKG